MKEAEGKEVETKAIENILKEIIEVVKFSNKIKLDKLYRQGIILTVVN